MKAKSLGNRDRQKTQKKIGKEIKWLELGVLGIITESGKITENRKKSYCFGFMFDSLNIVLLTSYSGPHEKKYNLST